MWPNPQEVADLVTFTKEILNEKRHFLCNVTMIFCLASVQDFLLLTFLTANYPNFVAVLQFICLEELLAFRTWVRARVWINDI